MRPETRQSMEMLFAARWNLPKAAKNAGLTNKEMKITFNDIVFFTPQRMMNDLRIYCQNEEDQLNVVSFLQENFPDVKICTWDPDPVDTGTWGMFVDEFESGLWSKLVEHLESEDCWIYEDMIELYLETKDGARVT